jgi:CelD/BcsL family acetyltransferase involved in cellulose biosynthesis
MISTSLITDERGLLDLRADWDELLAASASRTPFLTWDWMQAWWTHLRGSARLNVIVVRTAETVLAIAPLMIMRGALPFSSQVEFLGTGAAGSDYLDLIVRAGHERDAIEAIARFIDSQRLPVHLDHLPPSSAAERLLQHIAPSGWSAADANPDVCPFIHLGGHTWDSYLATLGSSHRANVRRRMRALESGFTVRFAPVESDSDRQRALEQLFAFHDQRWAGRGGSSAFQNAALRAFHHDVTGRARAADWLRLYVLSLNDEPVAVMYGFARNHRFYFYQHGFSEAHAKYGVGLVLMALSIRAAIDEGAAEFDMLYGHESYKWLWARDQRPLGRLQLFPPNLGGSLLRRQVETRRAIRTFAHQLGLRGRHGTT